MSKFDADQLLKELEEIEPFSDFKNAKEPIKKVQSWYRRAGKFKEAEEVFRCPSCSIIQTSDSDKFEECYSCGQKVEKVFKRIIKKCKK